MINNKRIAVRINHPAITEPFLELWRVGLIGAGELGVF